MKVLFLIFTYIFFYQAYSQEEKALPNDISEDVNNLLNKARAIKLTNKFNMKDINSWKGLSDQELQKKMKGFNFMVGEELLEGGFATSFFKDGMIKFYSVSSKNRIVTGVFKVPKLNSDKQSFRAAHNCNKKNTNNVFAIVDTQGGANQKKYPAAKAWHVNPKTGIFEKVGTQNTYCENEL